MVACYCYQCCGVIVTVGVVAFLSNAQATKTTGNQASRVPQARAPTKKNKRQRPTTTSLGSQHRLPFVTMFGAPRYLPRETQCAYTNYDLASYCCPNRRPSSKPTFHYGVGGARLRLKIAKSARRSLMWLLHFFLFVGSVSGSDKRFAGQPESCHRTPCLGCPLCGGNKMICPIPFPLPLFLTHGQAAEQLACPW